MSNTSLEIRPHVEVINGVTRTTSIKVAEHFGKRHDTVLRAIRNLECSDGFAQRNFAECQRINTLANGKPEPYYEITRDGFVFLAMGFTGKEAAKWKEAYIEAFNAMERELSKPVYPKTKKALPGCLTLDQQDSIKEVVRLRVESLPKEKQAKAAITIWSSLKSKFDVPTYKAIPFDLVTEAISVAARVPLEGELLTRQEERKEYDVSINFWKPNNRIGAIGWLTYPELNRPEAASRPLALLLSKLRADGYDIEGAQAEYSAIKVLLDCYYHRLSSIADLLKIDAFGLRVNLH